MMSQRLLSSKPQEINIYYRDCADLHQEINIRVAQNPIDS